MVIDEVELKITCLIMKNMDFDLIIDMLDKFAAIIES